MDGSKVMVTLSDGTAITLSDYEMVFSSAAADSPKIESMELSLYRTRMETEQLARSMHYPATQATSDATSHTAREHATVTVTQSPDGVVLVNVPDSTATESGHDVGNGKAHAAEQCPKRREHDEGDIDLDIDLPMPQASRHNRRIYAQSHKDTNTTRDGMRQAVTSFVFSPSDADIPESGSFEYIPPESYEDASARVPVTLPVIGKSDGFVSEMSVLEARKAWRRTKRRH
jgi:hypothetical protein